MRLVWLILALFVVSTEAHAAVSSFPQDVQLCSGRPWIDVTCNGADPTGAADSTTAINTTVNTAITNGWPVFFPVGTYKISSKLTWDYQGQAGNGLEVISRGATIDGRTIVSGNVLQIQCSGGTTVTPTVCHGLRIIDQLTVLGTTNAYVVVLGKTDFSDQQDSASIDHLVVVNNNNNTNAGAIQANYLTNANLWLSGTTPGGSSSVGAVALEQVQTSRIGGYGSAHGASAPALLLENGSSVGNGFVGFGYDVNTNTCISVTSANAQRNAWIAPYLPCTTAFNGNTAQQNVLLGPTFAGTNIGPTSGGVAIVGRGSLNRYSAPTVSSKTLVGADDGTIFSSLNATGASTQYTAASLPITLPDPAIVGAGWTVGFVTDGNKAVVATAPAGKFILGANRQLSSLTLTQSGGLTGPTNGNFQTAVLTSDGTNFRIVHISQGGALLNELEMTYPGATWEYPGGPGYQVTSADNGASISSNASGGGLTVTLPQTTTLVPGWSVAFSQDGGNTITVTVNGTSGGQIVRQSGGLSVTTFKTLFNGQIIRLQFDGTNFREGNQPAPGEPVDIRLYGADPTGVVDSGPAFQAAYNANVGCIFVPIGTYLVNTASVFSANHVPCFKGDGWDELMNGGTKIHINNTTIVPFTIGGGARGDGGFYDMAFYEDQPSDAPGWVPNPYQYIINVNGLIGMLNFKDLFFYNTTHCISVSGTGRETFDHIVGEPVGTCIFADNHMDIMLLDRIDFWVFQAPTTNQQNILTYMRNNVDPIILQRVDGPMIGRLFDIGYHSGLKLDQSQYGAVSQLMANALYLDGSKYGLWITGNQVSYFVNSMVTGAGSLLTTGPVIMTGSEAFRDESIGSQGHIGSLAAHGVGSNVIDFTNPGGGGRLDLGSLRADCYNQDNAGYAIFSLASSTLTGGAPHVISLPSFPTIECSFATSTNPANQFTNFGGPILNPVTNAIFSIPGITTYQSSPTLDTSDVPFSIGQGQTVSPLPMAGLYLLTAGANSPTVLDTALFLVGGGQANLINSATGKFVASGAPAAGKIGVAYNGGCTCYQIINNLGGSTFMTLQLLRTSNTP